MAPNVPSQQAIIRDPILLWLLIHGGDPAPEFTRIASAMAIHRLADNLGDEEARETIQAATAEVVNRLAGSLMPRADAVQRAH
jgi:hypothetical protein